MPLINLDEPLAYEDAWPSNPGYLNDAACLLGTSQQSARPTHLDSLRDAVSECATRLTIEMSQQPDDGTTGTSSGWIFRDTTQRRETASTDIHLVRSSRVQIH